MPTKGRSASSSSSGSTWSLLKPPDSGGRVEAVDARTQLDRRLAPRRRPLVDRGAHAVLSGRGLRTSSARGGPSTMAQGRAAQATDRCRRPAAWRHPGKSRPARAAEYGQQRAAVRSASSVLSARGGRKGHGANGR
jgi:hypothetical protein